MARPDSLRFDSKHKNCQRTEINEEYHRFIPKNRANLLSNPDSQFEILFESVTNLALSH